MCHRSYSEEYNMSSKTTFNHLPQLAEEEVQEDNKLTLLETLVTQYAIANDIKNKQTSAENKVKNQIKTLMGENSAVNVLVKMPDGTVKKFNVGQITEEDLVIDPRILYNINPEKFFDIVTVAKGNAEPVFGVSAVAKAQVTRETTSFKIKKV